MKARVVALAVWTLAACSRGGSGAESDPESMLTPEQVAAGCADGYAARTRADDAICRCEVAAGTYADDASCRLALGVKYEEACYCGLVTAEAADGASVVCLAEASEELADCVEPLACADAAARDACRFEFTQRLGMCDPLQRRTLADVQLECLGEPAYACPSGEAIPQDWVCDGQGDCKDMSDESDCEFQCGSGETVPIGFQCDGEADCADGSDEDGCEFTCGSGEGVPLPARCDGKADCKDMSDELGCA